jgi:serine/threonine-protein kinase
VSDQKVCPTCGTEYPLSERFCPRDGTALRSANAQADLLGSIVAERYHILKKLGEGGMGTVYLAEHVKMGRKAALKVMNPGMNSDPDAIARFNREAANASRLNHPNVCGIYDFGETPEGLIYLAMEFIEGESLTSLIEKNGALPAPRAASIIHQAADALAVAHDYGIVHRDLKPDNIMIAKGRDNSDQVKVVDFGIAKASSSDAQKVTKTGLVVGTPEYMSPEQLAGDKLDGRSDIYSLGLVAFNCLTGKLPFPSNSAQEAMIMRLTDQPKTLAEMRPDIEWPVELQAVMDKALARDADERYSKASEFGRDIAKAVENMPQSVAAGAGTQVMGAPVVAGAGKTAPVAAAVPKTRIAREAEAAPGAVSAPAAAPAKSKMPMLVGVAVVVIAAIGGTVVMLKKGGAGGAAQSPTAAAPTGGGEAPGAKKSDSSAAAREEKYAKKGGPAPHVGAAAPSARTTPLPAGAFDPEPEFAAIGKLIEDTTAQSASRVLQRISALLPKLRTLDDSGRALYDRANAYLTIDEGKPDRACPVFIQIRDTPSVSTGAANMIKTFGCK